MHEHGGPTCFDLLQANKLEELRHLLEEDHAACEFRDAAGVSLLMHALYRGHRDLAELIASRKTTLDIFEAASLGSLSRLKDKLSNGQDVNSYSSDGFTALHFACFFGQPGAARLLVEAGAKVDAVASNPTKVMPLHSAASSRNFEAARLLLERGAPVDARQQLGWVPIHAAAQNGDRPMVELLLRYQANPRIANDAGKTPAAVAREKGHEEVAFLLETYDSNEKSA
jgi:ankyrin repeat protein